MWASTRSWRRSVALAAALALAAGGAAAAAPAPPPLPRSVLDAMPDVKARGGGVFTFFGIDVYEGWYWAAARGWAEDGTYALDLIYHRDLDGEKIAQRSVEEITRLGYGSPEDRARWGALMTRIFPNVRKGDRITGVHTDTGVVRYYLNGRPIGTIDEPGFGRAFFGIWLDPKSSGAEFRRKLLGQP